MPRAAYGFHSASRTNFTSSERRLVRPMLSSLLNFCHVIPLKSQQLTSNPLQPHSLFEDNSPGIREELLCPQNGSVVLKRLSPAPSRFGIDLAIF